MKMGRGLADSVGGRTALAARTGLGRETLYRTLSAHLDTLAQFPTLAERGPRLMRLAERFADVQIAAGEFQYNDVYFLAAGHAWLELPTHADTIPLLLTANDCGRSELVDVTADGHIRPEYELVCGISLNADQDAVDVRIRDHFQARWSA